MGPSIIKIATIVGSNRSGRFAPVVRDWFASRVAEHQEIVHDIIDLAETPLPSILPGFGGTVSEQDMDMLGAVSPRLAAADGFVVITPEYNHSFPGALKIAIDWHNTEWRAKPVGFVSYGGVSGGLRAVEHLRLIFAELHAVTIRNTVSFANAREKFDPEGRPLDARADEAANHLIRQLTWWADVLRDGKARHPYVG
jgi:NAD(P)H-dependent FMN reductase